MVPNFGGFVSNTISSQLNSSNHLFTPPTKSISFNVNLQQNDGLLANHVAKALSMSFDEATVLILETVENWKTDLQAAPLLLQNIGQLNLVDEQLTFEPIEKINYLTSSFGLSDVDANYVLRHNISIPVEEEEQEEEETVVVRKKPYIKYIAAAAIAAGLFIGGSTYLNSLANQQELVAQQEITSQIQQASFNILNPLPAITLTVEKNYNTEEEETEFVTESFKYHIIAGAFKDTENADKKVNILNQKGYNASIIGLNKWGLTQVSYASFNNRIDAVNTLNKIRKEDNKHAWLFINE